jgi:hypothetical protein
VNCSSSVISGILVGIGFGGANVGRGRNVGCGGDIVGLGLTGGSVNSSSCSSGIRVGIGFGGANVGRGRGGGGPLVGGANVGRGRNVG